MPKTETIKINGQTYELKQPTLGFKKWAMSEFDGEENYSKLLVDRDPDATAKTVFKLFRNDDSREFFGTSEKLLDQMPADNGYLMILYFKIQRLFGVPYPDLSEYDMENMGEEDIKKLNAKLQMMLDDLNKNKSADQLAKS